MQSTLFQSQLHLTSKWYLFKQTALGKIYHTIPWQELAACLPEKVKGPGAPRWFDNQAMLALMFLKSYLCLSDEKLIDRLNTDWSLQLFCGKLLPENKLIKDKAILSRMRTYIAEHTDWQQLQDVLIKHWKKDMGHTYVLLMDATCYEIGLPTQLYQIPHRC